MLNVPATPDQSDNQMPKPTMTFHHDEMPEAKTMMPGDDVAMKIHGKVRSHDMGSNGMPGHTVIEIHKVDHDAKPKKKKNAANMPMDELKNVIKASEKPNDQPNS